MGRPRKLTPEIATAELDAAHTAWKEAERLAAEALRAREKAAAAAYRANVPWQQIMEATHTSRTQATALAIAGFGTDHLPGRPRARASKTAA